MNIFFDLGGTLLDISQRYYAVHLEAAKKNNIQVLSFKKYWWYKRQRIPESKILKIDSQDKIFIRYENERIRLLEEKAFLNLDKPFPWVYKLLRILSQKHKLYVLTVRRNKENLTRELKGLKLINFFVMILTTKPNGNPISAKEKLVKKIKLSPDDLLVGDTEADILTAKRLGIKSVAVSNGIRTRNFLRKFEPDFLIKEASQIVSLSEHIQAKLERALTTAGDMALKRRARRVVEELELRDGDNILEVGCGNGYYLSLLNRLGMKVKLIGIDNDILALKDAAKFIGDERVKLILVDASKIPFPNNSFDKIVMSEVIEHVYDERKVLKEIFRVLKKDGILTLTTCNLEYPFFWDPINFCLQHFFNTHIKSGFWAGIWNQHTRLYTKEKIEKLIKNTGFEIEQSESLTSWCLPFNHYIVNFIAKLFYSNKLPKNISAGMNKFQNNKQSSLVRFVFWLVNTYDYLNDLFPGNNGVSIFIKARK